MNLGKQKRLYFCNGIKKERRRNAILVQICTRMRFNMIKLYEGGALC